MRCVLIEAIIYSPMRCVLIEARNCISELSMIFIVAVDMMYRTL